MRMGYDLSFGIQWQAHAVLVYLVQNFSFEDRPHCIMNTSPWYNGRECGVCVSLWIHGKNHHIAWFEHRNSDNLCALAWESPCDINPPTAHDCEIAYNGKDKWHADFSCNCGEIWAMAEWVHEKLESIIKAELAAREAAPAPVSDR